MTYIPERFRFSEHSDLRSTNRKIVEEWFCVDFSKESDATRARDLFHPDGALELRFDPRGIQRVEFENLETCFLASAKKFDSWSWSSRRLTGTQYPSLFWAVSEGGGLVRDEAGQRPYENRYVHLFIVLEGKIWLMREWSDPARQLAFEGETIPYL